MGLAGAAETAARAIAGHPGWTPVVLCGRSESLCRSVRQIPGAIPVEWIDDMPAAMAAADVLVDNNCGMSAKEALAVGLPIVTFRPIPGHGRDDAAALERLGATQVVEDEAGLLGAIDRVVDDELVRDQRIRRGRALFVADAAELLEEQLARPSYDAAGAVAAGVSR
jgi:UDP-N-acetylglucosamine:LPS N-acetylglucosamine transferase